MAVARDALDRLIHSEVAHWSMKSLNNSISNLDEQMRRFRRVLSLVPEEDVVMFSMQDGSHFSAKLVGLSRVGALISMTGPPECIVGTPYNLYFQIRGEMFQIEGMLVRRDMQFLAFQFINITTIDVCELRGKLVRMEMAAA